MEEKSLKLIINERTTKISPGTYEINFNEEIDSSWEEVAFKGLSTPYTFYTINEAVSIRVELSEGSTSGTQYIYYPKNTSYTIKELLDHFFNQLALIFNSILKKTLTKEMFGLSTNQSGQVVIALNFLYEPNIKMALLIPYSFSRLLGSFHKIKGKATFTNQGLYLTPTYTTRYVSTFPNTIEFKMELFITSLNWVERQITNLDPREYTAVNVSNIINKKVGTQLILDNSSHLIWYPIIRGVKRNIQIQFSNGLDFITFLPGNNIYVELLLRKPKPIVYETEERLVNVVIGANDKILPGTYEVTLKEELKSSWDEMALYKIDMPYAFYNVSQPMAVTILVWGTTPQHYFEFKVPAATYTFETLAKAINDPIAKFYLDTLRVRLSDDDGIVQKSGNKSVLKLNWLASDVQPATTILLYLEYSLVNLLGGFEEKTYTDNGKFSHSIKFLENNIMEFKRSTEITKNVSVTSERDVGFDKETGVLLISNDWIEPQTNNFLPIDSKVIHVENLLSKPLGAQIVVKNEKHLHWYPILKRVRKKLQIIFSSGFNYLDLLPGVFGVFSFLIRRRIYNA